MSLRSPLTILLALVAMFLITACSRGISKSDIAHAINEHIGKDKMCFSLADNNIRSWPIRVHRRLGLLEDQPLDPISSAMRASQYLQVVTHRGNFMSPMPVDVITLTEEAKRWWDATSGFCVGTKAVADVTEWTEPGKESGIPIQVQYTWHLVGVPSWAKRAEFKNIPGMGSPVPGRTILQKTNKGWKVIA